MTAEKILFFDIDGTLLRANGAGKKALQVALAEGFNIESPNVEIDFGGRTDISIAHEIFSLNGLATSTENFLKLFDTYLNHLKDLLPKMGVERLPGISDLIVKLHELPHFHLGIITGNIERGAGEKLRSVKLEDYFSFGGFGDRMKERSGIAAEGVSSAYEFLGKSIEPKNMIVIGDTPHDVSCARAINAKVIAVGTGYASTQSLKDAKPDLFLDDLSEVDQFIKELEQI